MTLHPKDEKISNNAWSHSVKLITAASKFLTLLSSEASIVQLIKIKSMFLGLFNKYGCGNCPMICFWSFINRMEIELRQTSTITLRLADLITTPKIYLGRVCQEVQSVNIGKAKSNPGWGVSIPCTYNLARCPVSGLVIVAQKVHRFNLISEKPNLKLNSLLIPFKSWVITSAYLNPENLKKI